VSVRETPSKVLAGKGNHSSLMMKLPYASETRIQAYLKEKNLHLRIKGSFLKAVAQRLLVAAQKLIDKGVLLWPFSRK
jgi:hypothetical protein